MKAIIIVVLLLVAGVVHAQPPVAQGPDLASYATAFTNPAVVAYQDIQHRDMCRLAQLATSEFLGNVADLGLKKIFPSQRPCSGCGADGSFSGHTMNAGVGMSQGWTVGISMTLATGFLRWRAHEHTPLQVLEGGLLGIGADWSGKLIHCH